nr:Gag-Pol polyprotein [Tanacetum cinerariifolium]
SVPAVLSRSVLAVLSRSVPAALSRSVPAAVARSVPVAVARSVSTATRAVDKNGLPRIKGTLMSSGKSRIIKSTRKANLPILTSTFSTIPFGYFTVLSANSIVNLVCANLPNPKLRVSSIDSFAFGTKDSHSFFDRIPEQLLYIPLLEKIKRSRSSSSSFFCFFNLDRKGGLDVLEEFSVAGRGGAGKGGSCMLIPDLVVMANVGASGSGVLLLLIAERIWAILKGMDHYRCLLQTSIPAQMDYFAHIHQPHSKRAKAESGELIELPTIDLRYVVVKDLNQKPFMPVQTRRQLATDPKMCMYALTVSTTEPKNIKEAMADSTWIEAMQEELHQFNRFQ